MIEINDSTAIKFASDFTIKAIENGLIREMGDPKETAQSIVDFYQTIIKNINSEN